MPKKGNVKKRKVSRTRWEKGKGVNEEEEREKKIEETKGFVEFLEEGGRERCKRRKE